MKATHFFSKGSQFWLLWLAATLVAIYLILTWKSGDIAHLGMSILFWLPVASLLWEKRHRLSLKSGSYSKFLGTLLITLAFFTTTFLTSSHYFRLFPFISAVGLALLASGFKALKQYWKELLILFFLSVPSVLLSSPLTDISPITAKFSTFLLWYLGFKVSLQGVHIVFPTGGVEVYSGCSGMEAITYLLGLAVVFLVMFPTKRSNTILVPLVAVILGFVVNGARVALMAVLAASSNSKAFNYWHEGDGSLIFGMIAVLLLGLFCLFLLRQEEPENEDSIE
jgi:cyanoexosortase A